MKLLLFIFCFFLFIHNSASAKSFKVGSFTIFLKKNGMVTSTKKGKVVSKLDLKFLHKTARVEKFEQLDKSKTLFIADIFQGHEGVNLTKACFRANLLKISQSGKLTLVDKLIYRCDIASSKLENEGEESFFRPYEIVNSKIVFKKF